MSLVNHLPFVNEQIGVQEKLIKKFENQPWRNKLHTESAEKFRTLAADLEKTTAYIQELEKRPNIKVNPKQQLSLSFEEIQGLPEDLLSELSISDADKAEFTIQGIINDAGGIASLDRILVGLYKKNGEILKRTALTSRLYRMSQKDQVFSVPNKKGVYSTYKLSEEEAAKLFSPDPESDPLS